MRPVQGLFMYSWLIISLLIFPGKVVGFRTIPASYVARKQLDTTHCKSSSLSLDNVDDMSALLTSRLPTSVDDQVRQAAESLKRAARDGQRRHAIRLLLPVIGATELDDWPGGARQMMQAAKPLVQSILATAVSDKVVDFQEILLDESDGVYAILGQVTDDAKKDMCAVLLPSGDTVSMLQKLESQVGDERDLLLVNSQWKRRSDFGGFLWADDKSVTYAEGFAPTFSLTNLICEGESVRILRNYPGPWRVFIREDADGKIDWTELGQREVVDEKPADWSQQSANQRDGGRLFDYGQPSYQEIVDMLNMSPAYTPKSPAERAAAAFLFIKDTL